VVEELWAAAARAGFTRQAWGCPKRTVQRHPCSSGGARPTPTDLSPATHATHPAPTSSACTPWRCWRPGMPAPQADRAATRPMAIPSPTWAMWSAPAARAISDQNFFFFFPVLWRQPVYRYQSPMWSQLSVRRGLDRAKDRPDLFQSPPRIPAPCRSNRCASVLLESGDVITIPPPTCGNDRAGPKARPTPVRWWPVLSFKPAPSPSTLVCAPAARHPPCRSAPPFTHPTRSRKTSWPAARHVFISPWSAPPENGQRLHLARKWWGQPAALSGVAARQPACEPAEHHPCGQPGHTADDPPN